MEREAVKPPEDDQISGTVEDWERQLRRQQAAAWFITGAAIVAVIVVYCAVVSALAG